MNNKSQINSLLRKLYLYTKDKEYIWGICNAILSMCDNSIINNTECTILINYFQSQKPKWYRNTAFLLHPSYIGKSYWWENTHKDATNQRKAFIIHLINKTL